MINPLLQAIIDKNADAAISYIDVTTVKSLVAQYKLENATPAQLPILGSMIIPQLLSQFQGQEGFAAAFKTVKEDSAFAGKLILTAVKVATAPEAVEEVAAPVVEASAELVSTEVSPESEGVVA